MSTKECSSVKDYVGMKLSKKAKGGQEKWLPAILAIMADLLDVKIVLDDEEKCKLVLVTCEKKQCENYKKCNSKIRQFYIYYENQQQIFMPADQLPDELRIGSNYMKSSVKEIEREEKFKLAEMKGEVVYKHYKRGKWWECPCNIEDYKAVLASVFFFCPDVLWCAISNEMSYVKSDEDGGVTHAIKACLAFYLLLDGMVKKYGKEIYKNTDKALAGINNLHKIPEIEEVVIEERGKTSVNTDRVTMIIDAGSVGIDYIRRKLSTVTWEKKEAKKIMGKENYVYLLKDVRTVY